MRVLNRPLVLSVALVVAASGLAACSAGGGGGGGSDSINVLMVNNPPMLELKALAPQFTKETGIKVHFVTKVEQDMRDTASTEFANQSGQYDVATLSNFEIPYYAKAGWISSMEPIVKDKAFDQSDILPTMQQALSYKGTVYGEPFYGESSFLMYRKDVFAKLGITMPSNPTWAQVAQYAAKADGAEPGMKGICLRGLAGWGDNLAPLTTVVNTFGGTWFNDKWQAQVDTGGFKKAANFYVNLVRQHGEPGAANFSFPQCLSALQQGKVAMWYDSTAAAGSLEASDSPVKGKIGYVAAPHDLTQNSGWLYTWAWAIEKASTKQKQAMKFVEWASSKKYEQLVAADTKNPSTGGPANIPGGARTSTYSNPTYLKVAKAFAKPTLDAIDNAPTKMPGTQPRPYSGIQFVGIPSFTDFGTNCAKDISSAIAGSESTDSALSDCQQLAQAAGDKEK
ncbi:ABC transporter substrate-binding protein [Jatrophihabitans endophyticus]|uniref:ABC transporter substrate-binding protein n=1 Tax=Jatrophihabitans endophyticus TaxID=1206085 RepID=UPI0019F12E20|nr:sugar ABC transporter substrate-binding protein [Jatrophihabitans endophyticus]MBE7188290.1 sugar ABC transporter substrate-binding protein [Jatrophihabitans endophyticus]